MAELVDAPDSKSGDGDIVRVRVPLSVEFQQATTSLSNPKIKISNLKSNTHDCDKSISIFTKIK